MDIGFVIKKLPNRKENILKLLLGGTLVVSYIASFAVLTSFTLDLAGIREHHGASPYPVLISAALLTSFLILARKGLSNISALLFCITLYFLGVINSLLWGMDVPIAFLIYTLAIVISGIVVGSGLALAMTVLISISLFLISYLQGAGIIEYNNYWLSSPPSIVDGLFASLFLSIIAIVSWLSNKEIEKSLSRAESSERALRKERDMLEVRVEQRTRDLHKAQVDKMMQLYRFADFGKRASGLIHELVNPLTVVSINLEKLERESKSITPHDYSSLQTIIKRAVDGTQKIEKYVQAARTQIHSQDSSTRLSVVSQTKKVLTSFKQLTDQHDINVSYKISHKPLIYGSSIKFSQCITHLVANAIDALKTSDSDRRLTVSIKVDAQKKARISIHNNGPTIPEKELDTIFDAFYSTKSPIHGMGLGLSITKDIIEESFNGKISVTSTQNSGTTFTIVIPVSSKAS